MSEGAAVGSVGMSVALPSIPESQQRHFNRGPIEALMASLQRTVDLVGFTFKSIGRMLQGLISPSNLSGPITIAQVAASTAEAGWVSWLGFLALLSVSLGALNLLPIPVLDGGHLVLRIRGAHGSTITRACADGGIPAWCVFSAQHHGICSV